MTGQLRSTLYRHADEIAAWTPDLDTLIRAGDKRVRRRRTAWAGGLAALVVAAGATAVVTGGHSKHGAVPPAEAPAKPLAYAVGSVIHTGTGTVDVGEKVVSFVPTRWGFVFSTADRRLYQERGGQVRPITTFDGRASRLADDSTPLVVSDDGLVTAWWDGASIQTWPGYRNGMVDAFDKTNSFDAGKSWPEQDPPRIEGVADGHLWWWDGRDHWIAEVRPMKTTAGWKDVNPAGSPTVVDAAGDQVLVRTDYGMAVTKANLLPEPVSRQDGWHPGGDLVDVPTQVAHVSTGDLAPDGKHWFSTDRGTFTVYDSATGMGHPFTRPGGYPSATPYAWLGDDTIAAVALYPPVDGVLLQPVNLLVCHVSTGRCAVAAKNIGTVGDVALADGGPSVP